MTFLDAHITSIEMAILRSSQITSRLAFRAKSVRLGFEGIQMPPNVSEDSYDLVQRSPFWMPKVIHSDDRRATINIPTKNERFCRPRLWFFPALWIPKVTVPSPVALI